MELYHGDCIEVMRALPDGCVDMVLCDLPYGTTQCKWDQVIPLEPLWRQYNRVIKPDGAICLFGAEPFSSMLRMSNIQCFKYDWIWEKTKASGFLNAHHMPLKAHEIISVFYKHTPCYNPQYEFGNKPYRKINISNGATSVYGKYDKTGDVSESVDGRRFPKSVITFSNPNHNSVHPTQKPVPLLEYIIKTYTNEGETVLDNCMGSGSTGVACANTGRNFIGIERDPHWFAIAKERLDRETA